MKDGDILRAMNKRRIRKPTVFDIGQVRRWIALAVSAGQIRQVGNGTYQKA
jgi:hypothetical protein